MKNVYEITINNWSEYNPTHKKNYKKFMFYNGFFNDAKISQLSAMEVIIWINLLCMRSECSQDTFTIHAKSFPKQYRIGDESLQNALNRFESFQLLKMSKQAPNRRELKRIKENVIETKGEVSQLQPLASPHVQEIIAHYCDCWKSRYGASAPISGKTSGQLKQFVKDHGFEKSKLLISSYLDMADGWFLTKRHDIPTLLGNINSVALFAETGKILTKREVANLDSAMTTKNLIDQIKKDGI